MHKGVGLIIGNKSKTLFFVQQKDEEYPIDKWIDGFSFWGGEIEDSDNSSLDALKRELAEEIEGAIDFNSCDINFVNKFEIGCDKNYQFSLFELILHDDEVQQLENAIIKEGKGSIKSRDELLNGKWVWCLEQVVEHYFKPEFDLK